MSKEIPEEAKCTQDLDCTLLTNWPSYRSQLVRLCAIEKNLNWKHMVIDHMGKMTQLEPWYIGLNPGAYVPTMVTHPNNTGIGESAQIVTHMEENFNGQHVKQLAPTSNEHKERYNKFYEIHENWDVEAYSLGNARRNNFMLKTMFPFVMSRSIVKLQGLTKSSPELKDLFVKKMSALQDRLNNVTDDTNRVVAEKGASDMLNLMDEWLGEPNAQWVLGTGADYTLADVFATTFLVRLQIAPSFWSREVLTRPNIVKYWNKVNKRPSIKHKDGQITVVPIPGHCKMLVILTVISAIISLMIAGIAFGIQQFVESSDVEFLWMWLYCAIGWLVFFIFFVSIANCVGTKRMSNLKSYLETEQHEGGELDCEMMGQHEKEWTYGTQKAKNKSIKDSLI